MKVYFSDFFSVRPSALSRYGAFNISLINDLPLFIDPFLLFNSKKANYKKLHEEILRYVAFLRDRSAEKSVSDGLLRSWYCFPEVKQTWLGYSEVGNCGRGPGIEFARALDRNLGSIFSDFGETRVSRSGHLEKLCLIKGDVGRDNISDFVTNLIKGFLLDYTEGFAVKHISSNNLKRFSVAHVEFNYNTSSWVSKSFRLPVCRDEYVLLTPKDILTKDETWINKADMVNDFKKILSSVPNAQLREQLSYYFCSNLPKPQFDKSGREKKPSKKEISMAILALVNKYPAFLDYYIRYKEDNGKKAKSVSRERVLEVQSLFVTQLSQFISNLLEGTDFYANPGKTLYEAYDRVLFLKNVIENKDGYRVFYVNGQPIKREADLHVLFRLTWYASTCDVTSDLPPKKWTQRREGISMNTGSKQEVSNGRGKREEEAI